MSQHLSVFSVAKEDTLMRIKQECVLKMMGTHVDDAH